MKYKFLIVSLLAMVMVACQEPMKTIVGDYSYKSSGEITVGSATMSMSDEIGAMQILHRGDGSYQVTFNVLQGGVYTTMATFEKNTLSLEVFSRRIHVGVDDYDVNMVGEGEWLDGTFLFTLRCKGTSTLGVDIKGSDILLVAKKNK